MEVLGEAALIKKLTQVSDQYQKKLESALKSAALIVQNEAKQKAPVLTGNLRSSIHIEPGPGAGTKATVLVGTDVIYAKAQEFGLADRNVPPHPYLRPALDENKAKIKAEIARVMKR